jgi:membrane-bound ClpP family serine protease
MPEKCKVKGIIERVSSSKHKASTTRVKNKAWEAKYRFIENCSKETQREVKQVEEMVREKQQLTSNEKVREDIQGWLDDPMYSRTWDTKLFKTVETY